MCCDTGDRIISGRIHLIVQDRGCEGSSVYCRNRAYISFGSSRNMEDAKLQMSGLTQALLREIKPLLWPASASSQPPVAEQCRQSGHTARFCRRPAVSQLGLNWPSVLLRSEGQRFTVHQRKLGPQRHVLRNIQQ